MLKTFELTFLVVYLSLLIKIKDLNILERNMEYLNELFGFLDSERDDVRTYAINYLVGFSKPGTEFYPQIVEKSATIIPPLIKQCQREGVAAHDAIRTLINLTNDSMPRQHFRSLETMTFISEKITDPTNVMADLYCMLLSNLVKNSEIAEILLNLKVTIKDNIIKSDLALDQFVQLFLLGVTESINKKADFDFLSSVFAELTTTKEGRDYFLSTRVDGKQPITKVMVFSEYPKLIRRGGVISVIKNVCFSYENVLQILDPEQINLLPYILLPILGNEDYDEEDSDGMPEEVQLLDDDKKRESDPQLRLTLIEALLLLSVNRYSRDLLREKKVYPIVRTMHLTETDERVTDAIDRLVQLLMRDEDPIDPNNPDINPDSKIEEFEEI
ncbi:Protein HGH1-like protein [Smittium culicis]|uniref:Protein HGH1 homolog n=2 Tax=Smittium culicis TaxID=133412 RepID=A0A1R1Y6B5_9FUNG|nr:Protein HGH1-like protein [Smittium culicis]